MNVISDLFAEAESGNTVDKDDYEAELRNLRMELLNLQYDLKRRDFSVVLLIVGDDLHSVLPQSQTSNHRSCENVCPFRIKVDLPIRHWTKAPHL